MGEMGVKPNEWVFVGLGNPGAKYEMTRHNIGFIAIQALAQKLGFSLKEEKKFQGQCCKGHTNGMQIHLLLPMTYMNLSGEAVRKYLDFYKIDHSQLVVAVDDADLPFGKLRLREQGSSGGHNGLKSIEALLGTQEFPRLRLGIGRSDSRQPLVDYVLDNFDQNEIAELPAFITEATNCLIRLTQESFNTVMKTINTSQQTNHRP